MHLHPPGTTARFFQEHPVSAIDTLEALKAAMEYFPNPVHPARLQGLAIIELVEMQHAPRRPTEKHLPFCFVTTTGEGGATVECRFDFDAEGDVEVLQVFVDGEGKDIKDALTEGQVIELEAKCHKAAEAAQADNEYDRGQVAYEEKMAA